MNASLLPVVCIPVHPVLQLVCYFIVPGRLLLRWNRFREKYANQCFSNSSIGKISGPVVHEPKKCCVKGLSEVAISALPAVAG